jgi:flagellar basal-body rod protein FlgB
MNPVGDSGISDIAGWLKGLSRRQSAISNNIANIDTPGFQRQTVAFEQELQKAKSGRLATTNPRHIAAPAPSGALGSSAAEGLVSPRLDQNTVSIDQEMLSLAETQMRYSAATSALSTKIATLKNVIRG